MPPQQIDASSARHCYDAHVNDAALAARRCGVARSGETAAGIAQHSRLQKSANALQRPSWD